MSILSKSPQTDDRNDDGTRGNAKSAQMSTFAKMRENSHQASAENSN